MLKYNKQKILIIISIIVFLKPSNVAYWPAIDAAYKLLKLLVVAVILIDYIRKSPKVKKNDILLWSVLLIWLISTYRNLHSFGANLQQVLSILGLQILVKLLDSKGKIICFLESISVIAKIYVVLELVTIFLNHPLFADAMERTDRFFLGNDNYAAFVIIPLCGIMMTYSQMVNNKIDLKTWFFTIIGFLCFLVPGSVTAIVAFGMMILCIGFLNGTIIRKLLTIKNIAIATVIFVFSVVVFNVQDRLGSLLAFVGKNALNARETIWPKAVKLISQKPILGWGALTDSQIDSYVLYGASHAHNFILQLLLDIGFVGTILLGMWIYNVMRRNAKIKRKHMYIMQICIACYVFNSIFDFYLGLIFGWLLLFTYDLIGWYEREKIS